MIKKLLILPVEKFPQILALITTTVVGGVAGYHLKPSENTDTPSITEDIKTVVVDNVEHLKEIENLKSELKTTKQQLENKKQEKSDTEKDQIITKLQTQLDQETKKWTADEIVQKLIDIGLQYRNYKKHGIKLSWDGIKSNRWNMFQFCFKDKNDIRDKLQQVDNSLGFMTEYIWNHTHYGCGGVYIQILKFYDLLK